ncbi:cell envelope biogenesis protein OmpA [Sinomicrobium pectinilyticum]|uniref:Cell envelope biogenesis protein OmpA n=1 Tax=Sinomicrobium pectinilyticum TaxID=1084421 RepID=A0A3N0F032_SINP1|nr:OmpA family protein [Sinomicrobium pectinilyticum]RNL93486.1 cell envelope biogenesis protein OmpA [Sinomicrobium pectinilyticum]
MLRNIILGIACISLVSSCVSSKVYKDLESRYHSLKEERDTLAGKNQELETAKNRLENELSALQKAYDDAVAERDRLQREYTAAKNNLENLQESYDALEKNSSTAIAENSKKNRELLAELEAKENALAEESARLDALKKQLETRSRRVDELESLIASKDAAMQKLKDAVSRALLDFEGNGLTVEQRDGKVYVSMENKLLFESGSWAVGAEGRRAVVELGKVLAQNPDISVLIEGHTDNVPYRGSGQVKDNWDLSTKRATAIVQILRENANINPQNLTAAGRSEYAPVAPNTTPEGKAKNRRIEVILTPKLDEVSRLLNEI